MEDALWRRLLAWSIGISLVTGGGYLGSKLGAGIAGSFIAAFQEGPPHSDVVGLGEKFGSVLGIFALAMLTWFFIVVPIFRQTRLVSEETIQRMSRWGQGS